MKKYFYGLLFPLLLLLTACTSVQPQLRQPITNASSWQLQGRIAIKTDKQGQNASFNWLQQGQQYALRLFGPLGIGAVQLQGMPDDVLLTTSDGQHYEASSAEMLLEKTVGWRLPVSNLVYWIRGLPAPHLAAQKQYDTQHRLLQVQQQGWQVNYLAYQNDQANALPRLMNLTRSNISVRIVIDRWDIK